VLPYVELTNMGDPVLTPQTVRILAALSHGSELSGAQIAKLAKLSSGTMYPILYRLEGCGWLASRWETDDPSELGRPRRRFYKITGVGAKRMSAISRQLSPAKSMLSPAFGALA
jgi:PadR family transcriptional regulator PadR